MIVTIESNSYMIVTIEGNSYMIVTIESNSYLIVTKQSYRTTVKKGACVYPSTFHSPIVRLSESKLMPTLMTGRPEREKREA